MCPLFSLIFRTLNHSIHLKLSQLNPNKHWKNSWLKNTIFRTLNERWVHFNHQSPILTQSRYIGKTKKILGNHSHDMTTQFCKKFFFYIFWKKNLEEHSLIWYNKELLREELLDDSKDSEERNSLAVDLRPLLNAMAHEDATQSRDGDKMPFLFSLLDPLCVSSVFSFDKHK